MNVLILTPDAVGSTLLQRLITIYMQFHGYDRPVINLHELSNGLERYYHTEFEQDVVGKKGVTWGYHQSLEQIVEMLDSVDHYKTSRLAHYHIRGRQDSMADQIPFYQYLNDNFYIISCRRHNLFEHALSWCLNKVTKKLNVYSAEEKIDSFFELYRDGIDLDPNSLIQTLNAYKLYIEWCDNHFDVANYFYYEEHLPRIENYILNLPIFTKRKSLTWKDNFGISFDQWNLCHYLKSDLGTLALNQPQQFAQLAQQTQKVSINQNDLELVSTYNRVRDLSWPNITCMQDYLNLPDYIKQEIENIHHIKIDITNVNPAQGKNIVTTQLQQPLIELLPDTHQRYIHQHELHYQNTVKKINKMVSSGIIFTAPPIKKQTFAEKKHMIRNYQNLLSVYNQWIEKDPSMGTVLTDDMLDRFSQIETDHWNPAKSAVALPDQQSGN
jgi:hypothetical protein